MKIVYLVDPDPVALHSWSATLQALKYEVKAFESAEAFLPRIGNAQPGCMLLNSHLPGKDGLAVLRELVRRNIEMPVVMVTAHGSMALGVQAMRAGALNVLEKPVEPKALIQAVREAHAQLARSREAIERSVDARTRLETLSPREREVLHLVVAGWSSKDIASDLGISCRTVDNHRAHIMRKLDEHSLLKLMQMASEAKF